MICSKKNIIFLKIFKKFGIISTFYLTSNSYRTFVRVYLFFIKNLPLFYNFKIISKPGKPVFVSYFSLILLSLKMGKSFFILSTKFGIITSSEALKKKCGGELLGYF